MLISTESAGDVEQVFHSRFNLKARGIAILIHREIFFETKEVIADVGGPYYPLASSLINW